jgi:hypothetical protein
LHYVLESLLDHVPLELISIENKKCLCNYARVRHFVLD